MAERLLQVLLGVAGVIHVLPLSGLLGAASLARLYGVDASEPNLELLMRHRALLLALVGLFCLAAILQPQLRSLALVVGFVSVVSFLGLAWAAGAVNEQLRTVVFADLIALACLAIAAALHVKGVR